VHVAAGLMRRDDLQASSREEWRHFNSSDDDVDEGLTADERGFYTRFLRPGARVLLVGCGSGRDLLSLSALGFDVLGIDQSLEPVLDARRHLARRGLPGWAEAGDVATAHLTGQFDAVIFSSGAYSLLLGSRAREATLGRLRSHLLPEGCVLFTYFPLRRQSRMARWLTRTTGALCGADWRLERGDIFSRHTPGSHVLKYHHAFGPGEFARECRAAGFVLIADEDGSSALRFAAAQPVQPSK
jgi:SAM-dependent methyltransferase